MRHLTITKAIPTAGKPEDLTIEFAGSPPTQRAALAQMANFFYQFEAGMLCDALVNTLPGGTLDALLRKLLEYRASLLAVPFFTPPAKPLAPKIEPCPVCQQPHVVWCKPDAPGHDHDTEPRTCGIAETCPMHVTP